MFQISPVVRLSNIYKWKWTHMFPFVSLKGKGGTYTHKALHSHLNTQTTSERGWEVGGAAGDSLVIM